jgi:hypothetical protein
VTEKVWEPLRIQHAELLTHKAAGIYSYLSFSFKELSTTQATEFFLIAVCVFGTRFNDLSPTPGQCTVYDPRIPSLNAVQSSVTL